jgi:uroporphyrin-III C-methyltransferase
VTPPDLGTVTLAGAGPGSADLLTLRAARAIETAQALLYDALVPDEILKLAPRGCIRLLTGKRAGKASMAQDAINRLMLKLARRGLRVVRLKGGDPSIFGRSGEEKAFLNAHGVSVDIIPGVTAASAAAAQFGFPLTHRGEARRLLFSTARVTDGAVLDKGWAAGADPQTTLALYMGRDQAGAVADQLISHGRSSCTPVIAVENAGRADARALPATLGSLAAVMAQALLTGPVILLIGEVTTRADPSVIVPHRQRARS